MTRMTERDGYIIVSILSTMSGSVLGGLVGQVFPERWTWYNYLGSIAALGMFLIFTGFLVVKLSSRGNMKPSTDRSQKQEDEAR